MRKKGMFWLPNKKDTTFKGTLFDDRTILLHYGKDSINIRKKFSEREELTVHGELESGKSIKITLTKLRGVRKNEKSTTLEMGTTDRQ